GCELIQSDWRPTKLIEGVYEHGSVRMNDGRKFEIKTSSGISSSAINLAIDCINNGGQAIIFAETRKRAIALASKATEIVYKQLDKVTKAITAKASSRILNDGEDTELTRTLSRVISGGVGFHHAGLGQVTREIIEELFRDGSIKLLTATPTLSAGVNLPARRVILSSILRYDSQYGGNVPISVLEYKQLSGRAGNPSYDKLNYLQNTTFLKSKNDRYIATDFGRLASLLYIAPLTAVEFSQAIQSAKRVPLHNGNTIRNERTLGILHLITNSTDFYPKISLRKGDIEELSNILNLYSEELFYPISESDGSRSLLALHAWINEASDRLVSDNLGVEPGDMYRIVENAEWLSYSLLEFSKLLKREDLLTSIYRTRLRIKY